MIAISKIVNVSGSNKFAAPERKHPRPVSNTLSATNLNKRY